MLLKHTNKFLHLNLFSQFFFLSEWFLNGNYLIIIVSILIILPLALMRQLGTPFCSVFVVNLSFCMYAFSRWFYPKRLTVHSVYTFFVSMCAPWELNPQSFALLTQSSIAEPQGTLFSSFLFVCHTASVHNIVLSQSTFLINTFKRINCFLCRILK